VAAALEASALHQQLAAGNGLGMRQQRGRHAATQAVGLERQLAR